MRSISQRELRNDSAAVLRAVEDGESLIVTRRGAPIAQIGPIAASELRSRPALKDRTYSDQTLPRLERPASEALDELRDER